MDPVERSCERGQAFQLRLRPDRNQVGQRRQHPGNAAVSRDQCAAKRLKIQAGVVGQRQQRHFVGRGEGADRALNSRRAAHAADEQEAGRGDVGLEQHQDVLRHGFKQPGQDASPILALVRQVGHVALQNDGTTARERRGAVGRGREGAGFFNRQGEPLNQLAEEIAGALGAAAVLAKDLHTAGAKFEDRKTVAADRHHRSRLVAGEMAAGPGLRLRSRHLGQPDLLAQPAANRGRRDRFPIPFLQQCAQAFGRPLAVFGHLAAAPPEAIAIINKLDELDGLGADIDAEKTRGILAGSGRGRSERKAVKHCG